MDFDTGDTKAMLELCRVLKPDGILVLTTDFADSYYPPPGLWPSGSHRIYSWFSMDRRLIEPAIKKYMMGFEGEVYLDYFSDKKELEPKGYNYTEMILTMRKQE
jgi:ubiquinone/menaquinone biosynthesis C-methylase UbiE